MTIKDVIEFFSKEWETLAQTPSISLFLIAITAIITWKALEWRYKGIIESLEARLQTIKDNREQTVDLLERQISWLKEESKVSAMRLTTHADSEGNDLRMY